VSGLRWKAIWDQYIVEGASNIKTLLKFDNGVAGSAPPACPEVVDETGRAWTVLGATTYISTTQAKYGASSLYTPNQNYIEGAYSEDFAFGTGDFCIEGWVYLLDNARCYNYQWGEMSSYGYRLEIKMYDYIKLEIVTNNGVDSLILNYDDSITQLVKENEWHHYAVSRNGGTITLYLDGTAVASDSAIEMPDAISCSSASDRKFYITKMEVF